MTYIGKTKILTLAPIFEQLECIFLYKMLKASLLCLLKDFFETERRKLFARTDVRPSSGCIVHIGCPGSPYSRYHVTFPGAPTKNMYVHHLSLLIRDRLVEAPAGLEASHLCGIKKCVNPEHLVWETGDENNSRRKCHRSGRCAPELKHDPTCLIPVSK